MEKAFGATWKGERIGKLGDIVSFSFHANKNLTSIEGGALVLNNEEEAVLAQKYRLQGIVRTGFDGMDCELLGGKYNLTDVAARVGLGQLQHIERFNAQRKKLARAYFDGFEGGATEFDLNPMNGPMEPERVTRVVPRAGMLLVFTHGVLHQGAMVTAGTMLPVSMAPGNGAMPFSAMHV